MITVLCFAFEKANISSQFNYIYDIFVRIYRVPCSIYPYELLYKTEKSDILVSYGTTIPPWQGKHIHIYESEFFGEGYLTQKSLPHTPLPHYKDLPVLYLGGERQEPFITRKGDLIETNIDLIASSFFMLTRYEEVVNNDLAILDEHERFPATASIAYKERFLHQPVVNEYFELLWDCIKELSPHFEKKSLWGGKDFALCLTHDVDAVQKYKFKTEIRDLGRLILKQRSPQKAAARIFDNILVALQKRNDPYDTFDTILEMEQRYDATSTFFFMAEPDISGGYYLNDPKVKTALDKVLAAGSEIGLHAGYYSYSEQENTTRQKESLIKTLKHGDFGCRQHYLRWKSPDTWRIQEKCGLTYDTTLCFADHEGFRSGICLPFQPFDVEENHMINLWEIPLTIMDSSLFKYRKLSPQEGLDTIEYYMNTVKKYQGVLVLLWHNSYFGVDINKGWTSIYNKILECARNNNGLLAGGMNVLQGFLRFV